ncbi:MAG: hypothetical protein V3R30_08300, partial [Kiloniellales bacterium]
MDLLRGGKLHDGEPNTLNKLHHLYETLDINRLGELAVRMKFIAVLLAISAASVTSIAPQKAGLSDAPNYGRLAAVASAVRSIIHTEQN